MRIIYLYFIFFPAIILLPSCNNNSSPVDTGSANPPPNTELEGFWNMSEITPAGTNQWGYMRVHSNIMNSTKLDSMEWYEGSYTIDSISNPKLLDYLISRDYSHSGQGKTSFGIYKINGDSLLLAKNPPGSGTRPVNYIPDNITRVFICLRSK
jgi:uncharacterized protein (TIGR03067 family)